MSRKISINVYEFDELSSDARENAILQCRLKWRDDYPYEECYSEYPESVKRCMEETQSTTGPGAEFMRGHASWSVLLGYAGLHNFNEQGYIVSEK